MNILIALLSTHAFAATTLTLNDYLLQVRAGHAGVKAATMTSEGARMYLDEARVMFRPNLNLGANYSDDDKPNPLFSLFPLPHSYDGLITRTYSAGISDETPYGVKGSLAYMFNTLQYPGLTPEFLMASPVFQFTASLWRNFMGREWVSDVESRAAMDRAKMLTAQAQIDQSLSDAESTYWRLDLARESEATAEAAVARADRLYKFSAQRNQMQLVDRSDPLQALASLKMRGIELTKARDDSRAARLAFNSMRGSVTDDVPEKLQSLTPETFEKMQMPERKSSRADVLAAEAQTQVDKNAAEQNREKFKPTLELTGAYAWNSQDLNSSDAIRDGFKSNTPTKTVGLNFSMPLDLSLIQNAQSGYDEAARAQELLWQRKQLEQEQDWIDLVKRFGETKEKLALAIDLEKTQLEKLNFEKDRHMRGRTTLYQVISFENDYSQAQAQRIQTLTDLLNIASKMKLYGGRL